MGAESRGDGERSNGARLFSGGSGRFEIIAYPGDEARRLAVLADVAWSVWRSPFGLPERHEPGILVRLVPAAEWTLPEPTWRVVAEPAGGLVTVWLKSEGAAGVTQERRWLQALAEGALWRQGIFLGLAPERIWIADWLAVAAAEAVLIEERQPALLDAWRQSMRAADRMPPLIPVLNWKGVQDAASAERAQVACYALWQWLRIESGRTPNWRRLVAASLRGEPPRRALNEAYGERFSELAPRDLELSWQTAALGLARAQVQPVLGAEESRGLLDRLDRFVVTEGDPAAERVLRLSEAWDARREAVLREPLFQRSAWLAARFAQVHPFYRNAAGSLGRAWVALAEGREREWRTALEEWRSDFAQGRELETASAALLNEAEQGAVGR